MPKRLTKLELNEVSLVDAGANQGAKVLLYKRNVPEASSHTAGSLEPETRKSAEDEPGNPNERTEQEKMPEDNLDKKLGDLTAQIAVLSKAAETEKTRADAAATQMTAVTAALETATARADKAEAELAAELAKNAKKDNPESIEKWLATQPEYIRKYHEDNKAAVAKANKDAEEAKAIAKKAEDERKLTEFTKRADEWIHNSKGTDAEKGALLKALNEKLTAEEFDQTIGLLKAADVALGGAFRELGTSRGAEGGAEAQLEKIAGEIAKREKLSKAAAYTRALEENPHLYDQSKKERAVQ